MPYLSRRRIQLTMDHPSPDQVTLDDAADATKAGLHNEQNHRPECGHCAQMTQALQDDHKRQRRRQLRRLSLSETYPSRPRSEHSEETEEDWTLSELFHKECITCSAVVNGGTTLCQFCTHLRLQHLSYCVPYCDLPLEIPIRRSEGHCPTCPLCFLFKKIASEGVSGNGQSLIPLRGS